MAYDPIPFVDAAGVAVWSAKVAGDSNNRAQITADGQMSWGPGNAAVDTFQSRSAAGIVAFGEVDGVGAHSAYFYNSRSASGVNYERATLLWDTNVFHAITQQAGTGTARNLVIGTTGSALLLLRSNNTERWQVVAAGHLTAVSDNALDFGASGANRARSIYWGTQALGPDGSVSAPTYSFASNTDYGVFLRASGVSYAIGGAERFRMTDAVFIMGNGVEFGWVSSSQTTVAKDLSISRDAADAWAQRRGTNPQIFRLYNTFTNASNYERLEMFASATETTIRQIEAGTGTPRPLVIGTFGAAALNLMTADTTRGSFSADGQLTLTEGVTAGATPTGFTFTGAAHGTMITTVEAPGMLFDASAIKQWATGAIAAQREFKFMAPTYAFVGASVIAEAATVYISGAPILGTFATFTNSYALWVNSGETRFDGDLVFVDNSTDIGQSGANRPRWLYVRAGVNVIAGQVVLDTNGITMGDAKNIIINTTTGTKIGTGTTQKLGFWNVTPVVQPAHIADPTGGSVIDIECRAQLVLLLADQATLGLQAAV